MKEKEEDEERNENICPQTSTQSSNQRIKKLRPPYPLWSVDRRGAGQYLFLMFQSKTSFITAKHVQIYHHIK